MHLDSSPALDDLISALPPDACAYRQKHALAREAVLHLAPHLAAGQPTAVLATDLRIVFVAVELFLFGARYRTAFENDTRVLFAWQVECDPLAADCRLEWADDDGTMEGPTGVVQAWEPAACLTLHVAPHRLLTLEVPMPRRLGPGGSPELVDGLIWGLLRLMTLGAAIFAESSVARGSAVSARLLREIRREQ